jgi:hypothetical protein
VSYLRLLRRSITAQQLQQGKKERSAREIEEGEKRGGEKKRRSSEELRYDTIMALSSTTTTSAEIQGARLLREIAVDEGSLDSVRPIYLTRER